MSVRLGVKWDPSAYRWEGGATIRGDVIVWVDRECECNALQVALFWRTRSRGNISEGRVEGPVVFRGVWAPGDEGGYPFEILLPNGPFSYEGQDLKIEWYARLVARMHNEADGFSDVKFRLEPGPRSAPQSYRGVFDDHAGVAGKRALVQNPPTLAHMIVGVLFSCLGGAALWGGLVLERGTTSVVTLVVGAILLLLGLARLYLGVARRLLRRRLGEVEVTWPEQSVHPGEALPIAVEIDETKGLREVTATLIRREVVERREPRGVKRVTKDVFRQALKLQPAIAERAGRHATQGTLTLPKDAAPSFYARGNELSWVLQVRVGLAGWPQWKQDFYLDVRPRGAPEILSPQDAIRNTQRW